jgi:hypothetical protein
MRLLITLALVVAITTTIKSVPSGAVASIDGRLVGQTPIQYSDSSVFWDEHELVLKLTGYSDKRIALKRDQMRVGMLIGAIFVLVPVLWIQEYPEEMTYQHTPASVGALSFVRWQTELFELKPDPVSVIPTTYPGSIVR